LSVFEPSLAYKPFKYTWAAEAAKKQVIDMAWDVHNIELQDDIRQYHTKGGLATPTKTHGQNKKTIDTIQFLFTELDRTVADGYIKLLPFTHNNEIKTLFITNAMKETVHQRAYALLAETLGFTDTDWSVFQTYKEMTDKIDTMSEGDFDLSKPLDYAKCLTQLLLGEGIGLFAAFTAMLNFKRYGLLMGFNDVNSWSLADETAHVEFNVKVVKAITPELSYPEQLELQYYTETLVSRFVEVEKAFIDLIGTQEGIEDSDFKGYIEHLGMLRLFQLGYRNFSEVPENPLEWVEWVLSGAKHDNFFEKKVTDYSHDKMKGSIDYGKYSSVLEKYSSP
jgi:ribonucleotide reductase beta subunit family protein with ferritin-like domain